MGDDIFVLSKIRLLAPKLESNTGVAEALEAADAAMNVLEPDLQEDDPSTKREQQGGLGRYPSVMGGRTCTLKFKVELSGAGASGTVPLWASTLLPACDMVADGGEFTFVPGGSFKTLTAGLYENGLLRVCYGARGTFKITGEAGKPAVVEFNFRGKLAADSDATMLEPTFPTVLPPICANNTISIDSYTPRLSKVEIDAGNKVILREDFTDVASYRSAAIADRDPTGAIDPEAVHVATKNWRNKIWGNSLVAFNWVLGNSAGNTVTISSTTTQIVKKTRGTRNDLSTDALGLEFKGLSPFKITFG